MSCEEYSEFLNRVRTEERWKGEDIYPNTASKRCYVFGISCLTGQVLDNLPVALRLQDTAQGLLWLLLAGEEVACDLLPLCDVYCNPKYPIECRPETLLRSLQFLHQLLPLSELLSCSNKLQLQHAWLLLAGTQIAICTRFLPDSVDQLYKLVTSTLQGLLRFAVSRAPDISKEVAGIGLARGTIGSADIGCCGCFKALWQLIVCDVDGVSASRGTEAFWPLFNRVFNELDKESISKQFWVFERVVDVVHETSPDTAPNWSKHIQSLVQQSCNQPVHMPQALQTITHLCNVWKPLIMTIMTLQQHFIWSLLSKQGSSTIVSIMAPEGYLATVEQLSRQGTRGDTVFIKFLEFYIMSMSKIEGPKKMTLIKKVFDKIDTKALPSMSINSVQCLGLLLGVLMSMVKPAQISDRINMLLVSGDSISSCTSPEAMLNMYVALALLQSKLAVNCEVLLGQLGVILNRLSEDYTREAGIKQSSIFTLLDKLFTLLPCLMLPQHDTSLFLGSWVELMLEELNPLRCARVLKFVNVFTKACRMYEGCKDNMIASYNKSVLKPLRKYHSTRSCREVAVILANYASLLHQDIKHRPSLDLVLNMVLPKSSAQVATSVQFILHVIENGDGEVLSGWSQRVLNIWLLHVLTLHINSTLNAAEHVVGLAALTEYVVKTSELSELDLSALDQNTGDIISSFISSVKAHYSSLEFSKAQIFKEMVCKTFDNVHTVLAPILTSEDNTVIMRLYSTLSELLEELPLILHSNAKTTSPYTELFQTFYSQQIRSKRSADNSDIDIRKIMAKSLPRVFNGLSSLSYKTNTVFFKEILKVFNDIYPEVSSSDRKLKRDPPFLVSLFSTSYVASPPPSVLYFRQSFISYMCDVRHGYCTLPKDPEELKNLLYFLRKLEERAECRELVQYDTLKLYPFILQVFFTCVQLGPIKAPAELKEMSCTLLTLAFDHHIASELLPHTKQFIHRNTKKGASAVIMTLEEFLTIGGTSVVKVCLEELGLVLKGREGERYGVLEGAVLQTL